MSSLFAHLDRNSVLCWSARKDIFIHAAYRPWMPTYFEPEGNILPTLQWRDDAERS